MDENKNVEVLSDFDKLHIWNEICIKNEWSKEYELEKWLLKVGVTFTSNGSAVPNDYYEISNRYDDIRLVLMTYNMGDKRAKELFNNGDISNYALSVLNRAEELRTGGE